MKYFKSFEAFDIKKENPPLEVGSDMNNFNDSEKWVKDFNSRKSLLDSIYINYKEDATPSDSIPLDLYNKLVSGKFIAPNNVKTKITFLNPLFTIYAEISKKNRELKNINSTIESKKKELGDKQTTLNSNGGDKETLNNDIENLNNDIKTQLDSINNIKKEINDLQKSSTTNLNNMIKNLQTSKNRINKLDSNE